MNNVLLFLARKLPWQNVNTGDQKVCFKYILSDNQFDKCVTNLVNSYCANRSLSLVLPQLEPLQLSVASVPDKENFEFHIHYYSVTCPESIERITGNIFDYFTK